MSFTTSVKTTRLPEYNHGSLKGKIIVTEELQKQIDHLHKVVPVGKEWCGLLFYKLLEGSLSDPESFIAEARYIYLMDIGSETYTASDLSGDTLLDMYERVPGALPGSDNSAPELKYGLIHTHHNMATFFSGTDIDELHQNAGNHNYYVSLIVNYKGEYCAKVAHVAEIVEKIQKVETMSYKNVDDTLVTLSTPLDEEKTKRVLITFNLDVERQVQEVLVDASFQERFKTVEQEKTRRASVGASSYRPYSGPGISGQPAGGTRSEVTGFAGQGGHTAASQFYESHKQVEKGKDESEWNEISDSDFPTYDWTRDDEYFSQKNEEIEQRGKEKKRSMVTGLISELSSTEAKEIATKWMNELIDSPTVKTTKVIVFKNLHEGLVWFDSYFETFKTAEFKRFHEFSAKALYKVAKEYAPELVKRRLGDYINTFSGQSDISNKFAEVVEGYPIYTEIQDTISTTTKRAGKKGNQRLTSY